MFQCNRNPLRKSWLIGLVLIALMLGVFGLLGQPAAAQAAPAIQPTPPPLAEAVPMSNDECLECHHNDNMFVKLPSGETVSLTVDRILFNTSVHGRNGYSCVQCHTNITGFPHPPMTAQDRRDLKAGMSQSCTNCHPGENATYLTGDHAKLLYEDGNKNAAVCTDCHGSHQLEEFGASRTKIASTCRKCHVEIYDQYRQSVHGSALTVDFNPDVPTCVDCHSNHSNAGPEVNPEFHLFSPDICAKCHTNEKLMAKYGIRPDVYDTFVADFHGTTDIIFQKIAPDQETNKPVCIDCHGVHNIQDPGEAGTTEEIKQNILTTCQRCHPDATPNFSASWLSHYTPDVENNTIVYLVDLFYKFLIPGTIGGMAVFVITDFWRMRIRGSKDETHDRGDAA